MNNDTTTALENTGHQAPNENRKRRGTLTMQKVSEQEADWIASFLEARGIIQDCERHSGLSSHQEAGVLNLRCFYSNNDADQLQSAREAIQGLLAKDEFRQPFNAKFNPGGKERNIDVTLLPWKV